MRLIGLVMAFGAVLGASACQTVPQPWSANPQPPESEPASAEAAQDASAPPVAPDPADDDRRVLSTDVGAKMAYINNDLEKTDPTAALAAYEELVQQTELRSYEIGVIRQLMGALRYKLGDEAGALADFEVALADGALNPAEQRNLIFNVALIADYLGYCARVQSARDALEELGDGAVANQVDNRVWACRSDG